MVGSLLPRNRPIAPATAIDRARLLLAAPLDPLCETKQFLKWAARFPKTVAQCVRDRFDFLLLRVRSVSGRPTSPVDWINFQSCEKTAPIPSLAGDFVLGAFKGKTPPANLAASVRQSLARMAKFPQFPEHSLGAEFGLHRDGFVSCRQGLAVLNNMVCSNGPPLVIDYDKRPDRRRSAWHWPVSRQFALPRPFTSHLV